MTRVVDTSVVVRAAVTVDACERDRLWDVLVQCPRPIAHVLAESYAVLTRLPGSGRLSPQAATRYLGGIFPDEPLVASAGGYRRVLELMVTWGVTGGAIHDCMIAETAREYGAVLVTLDRRAERNYAMVGVEFSLITRDPAS